jgi:hypothetical protein
MRLVRGLCVGGTFVAGWFSFLVLLSLCGLQLPYLKKLHQQLRRSGTARSLKEHLGWTASTSPTKEPPLIPESLRLIVPPRFYAVPGLEMSLYFDNIVLTRWPEMLQFVIQCDIGRTERRRWTVVPTTDDVGIHHLVIRVFDWKNNKELARAQTVLHVVPENVAAQEPLRLLLVGDSTVQTTHHVNALASLLDRPGNPPWQMLGTHITPEAKPGVRHEGYGGWTWRCFLTHDRPGSLRTMYRERSPFLFPSEQGPPQLDVPRYFRECCDNRIPHCTIFEIGANDVAIQDPDDPAALDRHITEVLEDAERLLLEFRCVSPTMKLGVWIPPQMTASEQTYLQTYGPDFPRWRFRRNLHRYTERLLERFAGRERHGIHLIPAHLSVDAVDAYPVSDPGHPNEFGCRQFAGVLHAWIKWITSDPAPKAPPRLLARTPADR